MSLHVARTALVVAVSLFSASWTVAPTVQQAQTGVDAQPCLRVDQIHNFRSSGPDLYVRARVSDVFQFAVTPCPGLDFADGLVFLPDGVSNKICPGDRARMRAGGGGTFGVTCNATLVRKLTRDEVATLPDSVKP